MFWGEEDYIWLLLFTFMVIKFIKAIMVSLIFRTLLFFIPYGSGWNI